MAVRKDTVQLEVIINGQKAGSTLKDMRGNIRDLKRELDKLTVGSAEYNAKAAEISKATAAMNKHTKAIKDQTTMIENGGKKLNTFNDSLKKGALAALAFFSTQQIIQWGKEFIGWIVRGTAALELQQRKTAIVFGDAIDIVQDSAAINAQSLGVTETAYASLAAGIGDILIPMGFQREEAAKLSTDLTNVSGALAEWDTKQRSAEEIAKILSKALTGERESLKELGIVITEADVQSRLLAKGQKELTGTALQQAKAMINYELILERSKDAQTAFATNQDSIRRSTSSLGSVFAQLKEDMLSKLLPGFKILGSTISEFISPLKQQSDLVEQSKDQFNVLIKTLVEGNLTYEGRANVIKQINTQYKDYLPHLITEKTSNEELQKILSDVNIQMDMRIANMIKEEKLLAAAKRVDVAKEEKDLRVRQVAEQENLQKKLEARRAAGDKDALAERNNAFLLAARRIDLKLATEELAIAEGHLLYVRNQNKDVNADEVLGRSAELDAKKAKNAADAAAEEARKAAAEQAEKDREAREKRLRDNLKAIEDQFQKEKLIKIQAIESFRGDDELYNAERERITIETDIKIAKAQAALYRAGSVDNLKLLQSALDSEAKLRENASKLTLAQQEEAFKNESELRKLHIREEITDREDLSRALEIEELENLQRLDTAKLASLNAFEAEYKVVYNRITDRQQAIDEKRNEDTLAGIISTINITRDQKILALDEQQLIEEKYLEEREKIEIQSIIDSLDAQLTLFEGSAEDRIALELKIADARKKINKSSESGLFGGGITIDNGGGRSTPDDREAEREKRLQQAKDATLDTAHNVADTLLSIEKERIDQSLRQELDSIEQVAEAKRRAAGDDAVELAKIDAQAIAAREKAEKQAAQERKKVARKEAIIQGALAVVESLPNVAAAIAAGIATALQLAVIDGQSFFEGGRTGSKGLYRDSSGHDVAGVVHTDEYVVPKRIAQDPQHQPVISYLENVRRSKGGFAEGGFTNVSTRPAAYVQTVTSGTSTVTDARMLELMERLVQITAAWPREVKARVVYTELEKVGDDLNYIRGQANA